MMNRRMLVAGATIAVAFLIGAYLHISYPYHTSQRELGYGIQSAAIGLTLLWWVIAGAILFFRWKSTSATIRVLFALDCVIVFGALKEVVQAFYQ